MRDTLAAIDLEHLRQRDAWLAEVLDFLAGQANGVFLVGGYVRDLLLGRVSRDADFAVEDDPSQLAHRVAEFVGGNVVVLHPEERIYRVMAALPRGDGFRILDFSPIKGTDIEQDLATRDFTINAIGMALDALAIQHVSLPAGLVDRNGYGWRDLQAGLIRECSNQVFLEDPVRALRAFRFKHLLGFDIEESTLNHLRKYAQLIRESPGERIAAELLEILAESDSAQVFKDMGRTGLLEPLFPGLAVLAGVQQNAYHHLDAWGHTLLTVDELDRLLEQPELIAPGMAKNVRAHMDEPIMGEHRRRAFLRLAALFHDVGKASTATRDETGRIHFFNHQRLSGEEMGQVAERLRLSNRAEGYLVKTVTRHMDIGFALSGPVTPRGIRRLLQRLGDETIDIVLLSVADREATLGPLSTEQGRRIYTAFAAALLEERERDVQIPRLLGGTDLLGEFALAPGPLIGDLLDQVRFAQMEGLLEDREDALRFVRDLLGPLGEG